MPPPTFPMLVGGRLRRTADVPDAVAAARAALPAWSAASVHERGRVLTEIAEVLDERRDRLAADGDPGTDEVGTAVDRWLWYAGWTDKIAGLHGAVHPVDGPAVSWSTPHPVGVVGVVAGSLLGLVDGLASALAVGATAVVVGPHAVGALAEILAAGDLPPGAANLLTGDVAGLGAALARGAVDGLDLAGAPVDAVADLTRAAADRGLRVPPAAPADPGLARLRTWTEVTTVWQSVGR